MDKPGLEARYSSSALLRTVVAYSGRILIATHDINAAPAATPGMSRKWFNAETTSQSTCF